jgi:hypothetical protein
MKDRHKQRMKALHLYLCMNIRHNSVGHDKTLHSVRQRGLVLLSVAQVLETIGIPALNKKYQVSYFLRNQCIGLDLSEPSIIN